MHHSRNRSGVTVGLAMLIMSIVTACGSSGTEAADTSAAAAPLRSAQDEAALEAVRDEVDRPRETFVGKVDGTDAYVAIVDDGVNVTAYFCDSATVGLWFSAPSADTADASHPSGAAFRAAFGESAVSGELDLDGQTHAFVAEPVSFPAGLWEGYFDPAVTEAASFARYGWVVLPDGSQRGSKVLNTVASQASQVNTASGVAGDGTLAAPSTPTTTDTSTEDFCGKLFGTLRGLADGFYGTNDETLKKIYLRAYNRGLGLYNSSGCQDVTGVV